MKYGFIIDNRKCIGCHACTTACKSEHQVPVGVNRTWVKQVEKGEFPDTRRLFSVMRCNHCTDAPCVNICPTEALNTRDDGIVDFDKERCIGCKSCMQACPYDALYIDPETHTAAKCNYCAHRVDVGLEPACVNVCPEHAIISGDMEDMESEIAQLLSRQPVKARKTEKGTKPNLFYIDADDTSLIPTASQKQGVSLWGSQSHGVGHFAKEAEKLVNTNVDLVAEVVNMNGGFSSADGDVRSPRTVEVVMDKAKEVYNTPDKGILWGWEVSAYVWTKAIAAGAMLIPFIAWMIGNGVADSTTLFGASIGGLVFLTLTGVLLIKDLDQPGRFAYVLLRPHWNSWLVKGGYAITVYGLLLAAMMVASYFDSQEWLRALLISNGLIATVVAVYTAFLFGQAKGRDFWQSPTLPFHMLLHAVLAGAAFFLLTGWLWEIGMEWMLFLRIALLVALALNLLIMLVELTTTHPTNDAARTVKMIVKGRYRRPFWIGAILLGNVLPMAILINGSMTMAYIVSLMVLVGIYITEHIWVEAPQRIPLS